MSTAVKWQAKGLAAAGHDIAIITGKTCSSDEKRDQEYEVRRFDVSGNLNTFVGLRGALGEYHQFLRSDPADVMIFNCWQSWVLDAALPLLEHLNCTKILVSHGITVNDRPLWPRLVRTYLGWRRYRYRIMGEVLRKMNTVVFLSDRCDDNRFLDRTEASRLAISNVCTIPNGGARGHDVGSPHWRRSRSEHVKTILCVGRLDELKNEKAVLRAVLKSKECNLRLVFIAPRPTKYAQEMEREWNARAEVSKSQTLEFAYGLSEEQIYEQYQQADLFVQMSRTECQPIAILDAMGHGVPFVSSDVGCVSELPGGITVKSEKSAAEAIRKLLNTEDLRMSLGQLGQHAVDHYYNWATVGRRFTALVEEDRGNKNERTRRQ